MFISLTNKDKKLSNEKRNILRISVIYMYLQRIRPTVRELTLRSSNIEMQQ